MVKRLFAFFSKKTDGLHEAAYLLAFFAFGAQLLALVRDRMLASSFGTSASLDVYYAAFRIPDVIFVSVASIVSITVLIPFLTERLHRSAEEAHRFINEMFTAFSFLIIVISGIIFFLIPTLSRFAFPGITDPGARAELITLTRIILFSPILLGLSNFLASITQVHKRFFVYAISPILYNVGIIVGVVYLYPRMGLPGLAWGVALGALMHLLIQVPSVIHVGFLPRFTKPNLREVLSVVRISLPRTIALGTTQFLLLVLVAMASLQAVGSIAIFNLSFNLQSVSMSIIGVSYSLAAFPALAAFFAQKEQEKFLHSVATAARHIIFWSFPSAIMFIVLRAQIVRTIYGAGAFDWGGTRLTAAALALFSLSVVAQSLFLLFTRAYYAAGSTAKPLSINLICAGFIVVLAYGSLYLFHTMPFVRYFIESLLKVEDVPGTAVLMLPLSYSVGMLINTVAHWFFFEKDFGTFGKNVFPTLFHSMSASIVMGFVTYQFLYVFGILFDVRTGVGIFLQGLCAGLVGIAVGAMLLKLMGNKEVTEIWQSLHQKIWKVQALAPEQAEL